MEGGANGVRTNKDLQPTLSQNTTLHQSWSEHVLLTVSLNSMDGRRIRVKSLTTAGSKRPRVPIHIYARADVFDHPPLAHLDGC